MLMAASKTLLPRYEYFAYSVLKNRVKRVLKPTIANKYVFILSAPLCGSTLLHEILSTSSNVSFNNNWGTREGQKLPTTRKLMFNDIDRWDENQSFNWALIKQEWRKYWDITKPVLLEKSPPNLVRAKQIEKFFEPSYFIILIRNPYAQCEGLMRRKGVSAKAAAELVIGRMKLQQANLISLQNLMLLRYEDLCDETEAVKKRLVDFLPELGDLNTAKRYKSHNVLNEELPITNLNTLKIASLSQSDLQSINSVFTSEIELLSFFGYSLAA
jgi:hypothetical protein